ncbi:hypothetical protein [Paenibacillus sp. Leaf72]|uniref:hypothetical protein n=1 Tax=Paenibacillus sp. Leaf72 TaxID=1736234 RepID=UPI0006F4C8F2|nr:hypothetical protein [Paenibacillus sp. Leaf72]KQN96807.1 hypothetical protein ASF12_22300 [Paenibacillus sp. Leaf72]
MIGTKVCYADLIQFLRKESEWVNMAFEENGIQLSMLINQALKDGKAILENWEYSIDEMHELKKEKEGIIQEVRFHTGSNEGYKLFLRMESGQIIYAKTFETNLFLKTHLWATNYH